MKEETLHSEDDLMPSMEDHLYKKFNKLSTAELLRVDTLAEAEKFTGESYKDSEVTSALGFVILQVVGKLKEERMSETKDTAWGCSLEDYLEVVGLLGFELAYEEEVEFDSGYKESKRKEKLLVFAERSRGIVLVIETYRLTEVNGATIHWQGRGVRIWGGGSCPHKVGEDDYEYTYSKDVREGLRSTINESDNTDGAEFITEWKDYGGYGAPKFVGYWDWKINKDRGYKVWEENTWVDQEGTRRAKAMPQWFIDQFGKGLRW